MDDRVWNESAAHRVYDKAAWEIHLIEMTRRLVYQVQYINWAGRIRLERADRRQYINWGNHSTCFDRLRILLPTSLLNRALNYELTAKFLLNKAIQMAW